MKVAMLLRHVARSSPRLSVSAPRCLSSAISVPGVHRSLGEVAKVELFENETPARIGAIWESYHADKPDVAGSHKRLT